MTREPIVFVGLARSDPRRVDVEGATDCQCQLCGAAIVLSPVNLAKLQPQDWISCYRCAMQRKLLEVQALPRDQDLAQQLLRRHEG